MHLYWIKLKQDASNPRIISPLGFGITAFDIADAINLVKEKAFQNGALPDIERIDENVQPNLLDPKHVLPNIDEYATRGIWFPKGFRY